MRDRIIGQGRSLSCGVESLNPGEGDKIVGFRLAPSIAIASPYEIWSAGLEAVLQRKGWLPSGRWPSDREALAAGGFAHADVLVLAMQLVRRPSGCASFRPYAKTYFGKIVVVIEPTDSFTPEDFVALEVEGLMLGAARLDEAEACFENVRQGRRWVDPGIRDLLGQTRRQAADRSELSSRELQVARLAASGLSNKRIARALNLSDGTVKMHMHHILAKLRLNSRFDLVRAAFDLGSGAVEDGLDDMAPSGREDVYA